MSSLLDVSWADARFDEMMTSRLAVWRKDQSPDQYNLVSNVVYTRLSCTMVNGKLAGQTVDRVPCLDQALKGYELNTPPAPQSETSYGIQTYKVFCRLFTLLDSPAALTIRHFLQVLTKAQVDAGADFPDPNDANAKAVLYNVTDIENPALMDHHLELYATVITP